MEIGKFVSELDEQLAKITGIVGFPVELTRQQGNLFRPVREDATILAQPELDFNPRELSFFSITNGDRSKTVAHFKVSAFPGCCAYAISTGVVVGHAYRRNGINKIALRIRELIARHTGYTALIATTTTHAFHAGSLRTLRGAGYKELTETVNRRTGNRVILFIKELEKC